MAVSTSDRLQRLLQLGWGESSFCARTRYRSRSPRRAPAPFSLSHPPSALRRRHTHTSCSLPHRISIRRIQEKHVSGDARSGLPRGEEVAREEAHPLAPALIGEKQGGATSIRAGAGEEHGRRRPRAYSVVELRQAEHVQQRRATSCARAELLARRRACGSRRPPCARTTSLGSSNQIRRGGRAHTPPSSRGRRSTGQRQLATGGAPPLPLLHLDLLTCEGGATRKRNAGRTAKWLLSKRQSKRLIQYRTTSSPCGGPDRRT
jgi:hypothetical protein